MPSAPGEFDIIARYFSRQGARDDIVLGVGDDAAVLEVPAGSRLVAAIDTIVEGVHFPVGMDACDIGHRALAVNLSDLAAMGAEPSWALLSLSLPRPDPQWLQRFSDGFHALAGRHNVALVGGDTVRGPLVVTVQVLGLIENDAVLTRGGARPGDRLYVSGIPGEAAAGLEVIQKQRAGGAAGERLRQRFLSPEPRVALGRALRTVASAAMDVSDGLLADLGKLCRTSGCGALLDLDLLPPSPAMQALFDVNDAERFALSGGDDYELLFTVPPSRITEFEQGVGQQERCTLIGEITLTPPGDPVSCHRGGVPVTVAARGYDHFAGE